MKRKFILTFFVFSGVSLIAVSQADTSYWQRSFSGGINFNQASFNNWNGGGVNSLALGAAINTRALYEKDKWSWDNTADLQLGFVKQQNSGTRKAADQIFLNSVAGHKIARHWDLFLSGTFQTYFANGYLYGGKKTDGTDSLISSFMAPGQLTFAWGLAYKPNDWFSLRFSPFAPRFTFVLNDQVRPLLNGQRQKAYGVDAGKTVRAEWLAFQLQAALNKNLTENVSLKAGYLMYISYENIGKIDHRLDVALAAKLTKYISFQAGLILLYNQDYNTNVQIQQTLGLGLLYNATTFKKK